MQRQHRPAISVIVPVYKAENTIHRCVDSLLNQTLRDIEIILVDDGSPDYLIVLAQRHDPQIQAAFNAIKPNNPCCDELFIHLGKTYDEQLWSEFRRDTSLFILSWKYSYPLKIRGKMTFYGKLLRGELR